MRQNTFKEHAWEEFHKLASEKYDFATCQRADGSYYGSPGRCVQGKETTLPKKEKTKKEPKKKEGGSSDSGGAADKSTPTPKKEKLAPVPKKAQTEIKKLETDKGAKDAEWRANKKQEDLDYGRLSFEKPPKTEISEKGKETLLNYTQDKSNAGPNQKGFEGMNRCSRNPPSCNDAQKKANSDMDEVLKELPRNEGKNTAGGSQPDKYHRGIDLTENPQLASQIDRLKPGDQMVDSGFGSYSRNIEVAQGFVTGAGTAGNRNVIITSRSKEIRNIEHHSDFETEEEGVLPRGTAQTVRSIEYIGNTTYIEVD